MSNWPKLCVRCGERNPELLKEQKYGWAQITSQTTGGGYTSTTSVGMIVTAYICNKCRIIALIRWWVSVIISFGLLLGAFPWTFGAFSDGPELVGLSVLVPALFYFLWLILTRRHYTRFYIHFYVSNNYIRGFLFRNKEYKAEFESRFPSGIYIEK